MHRPKAKKYVCIGLFIKLQMFDFTTVAVNADELG